MRYRASALVLLWGTLAAPGFAQGGGGQTGFTCLASVAVPPTLRAEGLAELIGDIVINCQGGSTATSGQTNITAVLNGQITSRNLANGGSEALLLTGGPPFVVCNNVTAGCLPTPTAPAPNVFQGIVSGNQVTFYGVSVQPPSTSGASRVYRITNVRANANGISGSNVDATVSSSNPSAMSITNPAPLLVGRR